MPVSGQVFWDEHATNRAAPGGHRNAPGQGELLGFATDGHGDPCAIVETADGAFVLIRLGTLRRTEEVKPEAEDVRQELSQSEEASELERVVAEQVVGRDTTPPVSEEPLVEQRGQGAREEQR